MQDPATDKGTDRPRNRRRKTLRWLATVLLLLVSGAVGSAFWLKERELLAPPWLRDRISLHLAQALPDVTIQFGDVVAVVDDSWRPRFSVRDVVLRSPDGVEIISVSDVRASLDKSALLKREFLLNSVDASGVFVMMQRSAAGAISLQAGLEDRAARQEAASLAELVGRLDEILLRPSTAGLRHVDLRAITLRYEDLRAGRSWTVDGGRMRLEREGRGLQIAVDLAVLGGASGVATVEARYDGVIGETASRFGVAIDNIDARDVASQSPAFAWLQAIEAPISGSLRGGLNAQGTFEPLSATLQIGAGVIQPTPEARPIPINGAQSYISYEPDEQLLRFDTLTIDTLWGRGDLEGQAVLNGIDGGRLDNLVGQFRLTNLLVNPRDLYPEPVMLDAAELDFRLSLKPFLLEVGRFQLSDLEQVLTARGRISAGQKGWTIAMDGEMDALSAPRLIALWPTEIKPKTRRWIGENVHSGQIKDATAALRMAQGAPPRLALGFDFEGAEFTFVKSMPPVQNARGHASLIKDRFVMVLDDGTVMAPQGGSLDAAGTAFIVPDTKAKPDPPGVVRLAAEGPVTATLSLLDQPPLEVMQKAGRPVALLEGKLAAEGTILLPLKKKMTVDEVAFDIEGRITDARSDVLVDNRIIEAPDLLLKASEERVQIAGRGLLDGVPLNVTWQQALGTPGTPLPGRVTGEVAITPAALTAFNIDLPPGYLTGEGRADITIDLLKGAPPKMSLRSDLRGIRLSVPPVGWSKPAGTAGVLALDATLGPQPQVNKLEIDAPGLYASGSVTLSSDKRLDRVRFDLLRVEDWLNASVDLVGRGAGQPVGVELRGGTVDLRKAELGNSQGGGNSGPLSLALDRVQISDTISITDLQGNFATSGGLSGNFQGLVNGVAAINGQVSPRNGRSAVQVTSDDAGRVMAAAGLTRQAQAGQLDLTLVPVGTGGAFDGTLKVADTRIKDAPTMAALLNAISVVGLVNELSGDGIYFSEVTADFRLAPSRITLREAAAVGASMGLSMDGIFAPDTGEIQMQGVISPIYALNAIGSVLTRPGEGLFGFNYSVSGTVDDPDVFVNPLTALAPGMLRNLFRRAQPDVPLEEGEAPPVVEERPERVQTRGEDR